MADRRTNNPFEEDGPSDYDRWNYIMGQAHGQLIVELSSKVDFLQQTIQEHANHHQAANRAVLDLPATDKTEKPN